MRAQVLAPGAGKGGERSHAVFDLDERAGELPRYRARVVVDVARADDAARLLLDGARDEVVAVDALAGHGQKDVAGDELAGIPDEPAHAALLGTRVGDELALDRSVNLADRKHHHRASSSSAATSRSSKWCFTVPMIW